MYRRHLWLFGFVKHGEEIVLYSLTAYSSKASRLNVKKITWASTAPQQVVGQEESSRPASELPLWVKVQTNIQAQCNVIGHQFFSNIAAHIQHDTSECPAAVTRPPYP